MKQLSSNVNRIPVNTWRRLRVNNADLVLYGPDPALDIETPDIRSASGQIELRKTLDGLTFSEDATDFFATGEIQSFIDTHRNRCHYIRIPKNHSEEEPMLFEFRLHGENPVLMDDIVVEAEAGSSGTLLLKYTSPNGEPVHHCGRTRIFLHPNADIKLIKVQMLGSEATHTDVVGGIVHEGAHLQVILAEIGAARPISSCNLVLAGEESSAHLDVLYLGDGARSLDISCRVEHRGRKSLSHIRAKGILLGQSKKVLRDTLDFISGASGSKGREEESVLMLDPGVCNISVPLLLCGEDDVEGEHAASSGRPDDKMMFYLMSRGINELEAKKLLAEAAFSSVIETIPDETLRGEILGALRESIMRGGKGN